MRQRYIAIVTLSRRSQNIALSYAQSVADSPPTSRIARTRRFGGLVAGPGHPLGRNARGEHAAQRREGRRRHRRARRGDRPRARQAARPDARRGDEDRPGPLDGRLHGDPRIRARGVQADARDAARRRPAAAVQQDREAAQGRAGREARATSSASSSDEAFAAASIGQVHKRGHDRGQARRGQDPVPGHRGGGGDRPAQHADGLPAGQAARPRPRRQGARPGAARAHRRRARLRGRGPEPPRDGTRVARPPLRPRPERRHAALPPPRARHRADLGQALRGDQAPRRTAAGPLRRDRLPLLLRHAQAHTPRRAATPTPATTC